MFSEKFIELRKQAIEKQFGRIVERRKPQVKEGEGFL